MTFRFVDNITMVLCYNIHADIFTNNGYLEIQASKVAEAKFVKVRNRGTILVQNL